VYVRKSAKTDTYLDAFGRRVLAAVAVFEVGPVPAVAAAVPEGRRYACAHVPGAGGLLAVAGFLEYDGEALGRGRILHVPLPKLGQRMPVPLVLQRNGMHARQSIATVQSGSATPDFRMKLIEMHLREDTGNGNA